MLTPTYINILNVYAFCNTHDITWGTKGDDKPEKLPTANLKPGGKVDVDLPQDDGDLNMQYENEMRLFAAKAPKEKRVISEAEHQEDYYVDKKTDSDRNATIYMAVVLWSVAALALFRFIGAMWFLIVRLVSTTMTLLLSFTDDHLVPWGLTQMAGPRHHLLELAFWAVVGIAS